MGNYDLNIEFPRTLPEPKSYYSGVDDPTRPRTRNVILFMRTDRESLQQRDFSNRSHHRYVLILALKTSGDVIIDGNELHLHEGEGVLIRPFQFHHYINLEQDDLRWLFITFDLDGGSGCLPEFDGCVLQPDRPSLALWSEIAHTWSRSELNKRPMVIPMLV